MGYFIRYHNYQKKQLECFTHKNAVPILTSLCFCFFLLLVKGFWPKGYDVVYNVLGYRDIKILENAIQYIYTAVQNGQAASEAIKCFCLGILNETMLAG